MGSILKGLLVSAGSWWSIVYRGPPSLEATLLGVVGSLLAVIGSYRHQMLEATWFLRVQYENEDLSIWVY